MAISTDIDFPADLPCALREGQATQHVQPFRRSEMVSGRAVQRRKFTSVPSVQQFSWLFNDSEAAAFEAWFRDAISDGAAWFNMQARTPLGKVSLVCRFTEMYSGPDITGRNLWRIRAPLEVWERPLMPPGWGLMPDYLIHSSIFDIAMNKKWPVA